MLRTWIAVATIVVLSAAAVGIGAEPVPSNEQAANQKLLEEKLAELNRLQREIDELRAASGTAQHILVKLQVLEVSRTRLRALGMDFSSVVKSQDRSFVAAQLNKSSGTLEFGKCDPADAFRGFIEALQKSQAAKMLAESSLVIVCGRPATFEVGGQVPLPAAPGSGKAVEFQSFGTKLDVMAVTLSDKNFRMELRVRLSEPDYGHSVQIAGAQVPVMNVRELDTALELKAGQSGYLNGMVQTRETAIETESGINTETEEIETWFIVTPALVPEIASSPSTVR
jgi:Flp pilus assembly secretin CpaC